MSTSVKPSIKNLTNCMDYCISFLIRQCIIQLLNPMNGRERIRNRKKIRAMNANFTLRKLKKS